MIWHRHCDVRRMTARTEHGVLVVAQQAGGGGAELALRLLEVVLINFLITGVGEGGFVRFLTVLIALRA